MTIKLKLEQKTVNFGEEFELPDYSFNPAYIPSGGQVTVWYLTPSNDDESNRIKMQTTEIVAHLLKQYS